MLVFVLLLSIVCGLWVCYLIVLFIRLLRILDDFVDWLVALFDLLCFIVLCVFSVGFVCLCRGCGF